MASRYVCPTSASRAALKNPARTDADRQLVAKAAAVHDGGGTLTWDEIARFYALLGEGSERTTEPVSRETIRKECERGLAKLRQAFSEDRADIGEEYVTDPMAALAQVAAQERMQEAE